MRCIETYSRCVGNIGIRIDETQALSESLRKLEVRLGTIATDVRSELGKVAMGQNVGHLIGSAGTKVGTIGRRLSALAVEMQNIAWNGPTDFGQMQLINPLDYSPTWALGYLQAAFDKVDGSVDCKKDKRLTLEELLKTLEQTTDPKLAAAILRLLSDPALYSIVDTGTSGEDADGVISMKDLDKSLQTDKNGVLKVDLEAAGKLSQLLEDHLALFDTAAHGGKSDGKFSKNDLKEIVGNPKGYSPEEVAGAQFILDNQWLLKFSNVYAEQKGHFLVRLAKGLGDAGLTLVILSNPVFFLTAFAIDPEGTRKRAVGFIKGVGDFVLDVPKTAVALAELSWTFSSLHMAIDPEGARKEQEEFFRGIQYLYDHPMTLVEGLIEMDTLESDPSRWAGKKSMEVLLAILTAGESQAGTAAMQSKKLLNTVDNLKKMTNAERVAFLSSKIAVQQRALSALDPLTKPVLNTVQVASIVSANRSSFKAIYKGLSEANKIKLDNALLNDPAVLAVLRVGGGEMTPDIRDLLQTITAQYPDADPSQRPVYGPHIGEQLVVPLTPSASLQCNLPSGPPTGTTSVTTTTIPPAAPSFTPSTTAPPSTKTSTTNQPSLTNKP
jgi:hypothetical protein